MKSLISIFLLIFSYSAVSQTVEDVFTPFQEILSKHLVEKELESGGLVSAFQYPEASNYPITLELRNRQKDDLKKLNLSFLTTKNEANAFWINAYNFFMIDYILTHRKDGEIVSGVKDYGSFLNPYKVFKKEFINISGQKYDLDQIEKRILLGDKFKEKGWFDAKVHFAVNCASVGCPPLRKKIYTSSNTQDMLIENTKMALSTPRHLTLKGETLYLTHLFKWYAHDFERESGTVIKFIKKYAPKDISAKINEQTHIEYIEYDWSLNKPSNFKEL